MRLRNEKAIAVGITAVALAVRLYFAYTLYLNPDECMHLIAASAGDWAGVHHPPLLLWWFWAATLVSEQVGWLRLLPVVAGALTVPAVGLWLRRFLSPGTAWGLAAFVAVSPNLVLLSIQLRGYAMAMLGTVLALYALDRAIAERSRRMLVWHFSALLLAILSEFGAVWVLLAAGLYGVAVMARRQECRVLLPLWVAGQCALAGVMGMLYLFILRVVTEEFPVNRLLTGYLHASVPAAGQNPLAFVAIGSWKQFAYLSSSWAAGLAAGALAAAGLWVWWRRADERFVLVTAVFLPAVAALAMLYPFGRSRHTVLTGLVALAAMGAGIELLGRYRVWLAAAAAVTLCVLPTPDTMNIPLPYWERAGWERALAEMTVAIPDGATVLTDRETALMLQTQLVPRGERRLKSMGLRYKGWRVVNPKAFDWKALRTEQILAMAPAGPVWVIDMGFSVANLKGRAQLLGLTPVIDVQGVLYAGRLR